jgi:hypothetical protein
MKAYIYQAALLCEDCGVKLIDKLPDWAFKGQRDFDYPTGPYPDGNGPADCPQSCDYCGVFLGNPLTSDGEEYVKRLVGDHTRHGYSECVADWRERYAYLFTEDQG